MCCGFVGDVIGGVVDAIGSVASFVIDNALPIIETVALTTILGPAGLGLSELTSTVISRVAVTALNGGSLGSIAAAGLTPFIPSIGQSLGINLNAGSYLAEPISKVITDPTIAKIVTGAVGSAITGGAVAAVTGGDVMQAAAMAGLSGVVQQGLVKTWDVLKTNSPAIQDLSNSIQSTYNELTGNSTYKTIQQMQADLDARANAYNAALAKYQPVEDAYQAKLDAYNAAKDAGDVNKANAIAKELNNTIIPGLNTQANSLNDMLKAYNAGQGNFQDYLKTNSADVAYVSNLEKTLNTASDHYTVLSNQINADYAQYQTLQSIQQGDYTAAAKYQQDFNAANTAIAKIDQTAEVGHDLSNQQIDLLNKIATTTDPTLKNQLISQAKLNQGFTDIAKSPPIVAPVVNPTTPTTPTKPVAPPPVIDTRPPPPPAPTELPHAMGSYSDLPKLPDTGVPSTGTTDTTSTTTPTTTDTTTPTTTPTSSSILPTSMGAAVTPTIGSTFLNNLTNTVGNVIKGGVVGTLTNDILGNNTGTSTQPKTPTLPPKPPSHVDVSTLTPVTGGLPANLPGKTTGTTTTGGLPTTGGTTTNTGTTPTQTGTGGLPSGTTGTTPTTPPAKVDVSTLKPVTDTAYLHSLGIV